MKRFLSLALCLILLCCCGNNKSNSIGNACGC